MNRESYSSLLFGVLALSLILFGIPLKVSAYHSGSVTVRSLVNGANRRCGA